MSNALNDTGLSSYNKTMEVLLTLKKLQNLQQQRFNFAGINGLAEKIKGQSLCGLNSPTTLNNTLNAIQNSFQSPLSAHLQTPIPGSPNQPKGYTFDPSLFLNNSNLSMRSFHTLLPNSKPLGSPSSPIMPNSMFSKPKNMDLESLMESLYQSNRLEKMETESEQVQVETGKFVPEFECKKEVVSRADTSDDANLSQNDNKKDGILRPDAIKENGVLPLSPMSSIQQLDTNLKSFKMQRMDSESPFKNTIETAALDTIKTALSAQLLLGEALKKAALLNNLMNMQVNCSKS